MLRAPFLASRWLLCIVCALATACTTMPTPADPLMDPAVAKLMHDHPEPLLHSVALAPPTFLPPPGKAKAADADNAFAGRDGDKATARRPFVSGQLQSAFGEQLTNFGLFRTVELIKPFKAAATREQQRELLLRYANELGADLLLIPRVSRHDVSFVAASGWWIGPGKRSRNW